MTDHSPEASAADASKPQEGLGGDFFVNFAGKLGKDALRYIPALVTPAALGFVGVAIFTRIFSTVEYGQYALVVAATSVVVSVLGGWMQQSVMRYLPQYREKNMLAEFTARLSVLVGLAVALLVVVSVVVYAAAGSLIENYRSFYIPCVLLILFTVVYTVYSTAFVANLQPATYARYQVAQGVGKLVFALLYVFLISRSVVGVIIGSALAYAVLVPPMMSKLDVLGSLRKTSRLVDGELMKRFFLYGFPIVGQNAAQWLLDLSDRFVIGYFKGPDQVGIYAPNCNLATTVVAFVAGPVLFAAHPLIVNAWEGGNQARIQGVITTCSRYFLLLTLPVAVFTSVFAQQIASVLFGEAFREGFVVVPLVALGMVLFNFGLYGHKGIKLLEKTGLLFAMVLVCAVVKLGLNMVLVPLYGYLGAGVATFFSYGLYPVLVFWVTRRYLPWFLPWRSIRNVAVASLAAAGFWWLLRTDLTSALDWIVFIVLGSAGFAVYAVILLLLGEVRDFEKQFVKVLIARFSGKG